MRSTAWARTGRLQTAPVASKKGSSAESSRRMMASPIGCSAHGLSRRARRIERHGVAEHDLAFVQGVGQQLVGRAPAAFEPIRLRKDDVQRDGRRTKIAQARHELTDHVAPPRPLTDRRQTVVIDVDDHDAAGCRADRSVAQDGVVRAVFPVAKERRAEEATAAPQ